MLKILIYGMVYLGSALMVYNIYSYVRYAQEIRGHGDWKAEERILRLPILLLVMFLIGYLLVGLFGKPDIIISGILFGGSVFVAIMVYLIRRITIRVQENEKLEAKLLAAEAGSQAKSSFLSNMSHEMRTPLNAILGIVRLLSDNQTLEPGVRDYVDRIEGSAQHLLALINDVLDMSYLDGNRMTLKEDRFSFGEVMLQFNSFVSGRCHDKGLEYNCERIGSIDEEFVGDVQKLIHVLLSIADNAVKFTTAPGFVRCCVEQIGADEQTRTLRFIVQDNGVGIDKDFIGQVFDAFSREENGSTSRHSGSGLGLAIAKSITELMHGSIDIESEKGIGTKVTLVFTLGAAEREETAEDTEERRGLAGRRILIVEDIDLNAEILMDLLEMEDIASERAENGQIGVEMFQGSAPGYYDAILMDLRMPVMDGLEATRRIRALDRPDAKTIPILALTANAFDEDVQASLSAGMNAHLAKPADIDLLCRKLTEYIH